MSPNSAPGKWALLTSAGFMGSAGQRLIVSSRLRVGDEWAKTVEQCGMLLRETLKGRHLVVVITKPWHDGFTDQTIDPTTWTGDPRGLPTTAGSRKCRHLARKIVATQHHLDNLAIRRHEEISGRATCVMKVRDIRPVAVEGP